jgi:hypothetical protein
VPDRYAVAKAEELVLELRPVVVAALEAVV